MESGFEDLAKLNKKPFNKNNPIYDNDFETIHLFVGILVTGMFAFIIAMFAVNEVYRTAFIVWGAIYIIFAFAVINILFNLKRIRINQRQIYFKLEQLSQKTEENKVNYQEVSA